MIREVVSRCSSVNQSVCSPSESGRRSRRWSSSPDGVRQGSVGSWPQASTYTSLPTWHRSTWAHGNRAPEHHCTKAHDTRIWRTPELHNMLLTLQGAQELGQTPAGGTDAIIMQCLVKTWHNYALVAAYGECGNIWCMWCGAYLWSNSLTIGALSESKNPALDICSLVWYY